jgi:HSP20 family molecular chaperone IbpA
MFRRYEEMVRQMEREMLRFQQEAFGHVLGTGGWPGRMWQPNVDVCESEDCVWVRLEAAGLDLDRTRVTLGPDNRVLTVTGYRPEPSDACERRLRCHQLEIYFGHFERDILLPDVSLDREAVRADYRDGMLIVTLPKRPVCDEDEESSYVADLE